VVKYSFPVCICEGSKDSVRRHFFLSADGKRAVPFSAQEFPTILSAFSVNVGSVDVGIKLWKKLSTPDSPSGIRHASAAVISTHGQSCILQGSYAPSRLAIQKRAETMLWACSGMSLSTSRRGTSACAVLSELWRTESKVLRASVSAVAIVELISVDLLQLWLVRKFDDQGEVGKLKCCCQGPPSLDASILLSQLRLIDSRACKRALDNHSIFDYVSFAWQLSRCRHRLY
jgi:hypothetical protein